MARIAPTTAISLCLAAACGAFMLGCTATGGSGFSSRETLEPAAELYVCTLEDLDAIPTGKEVQFFDLSQKESEETDDGTTGEDGTETPDVSEIQKAMGSLYADCGFVAVDLSTGKGIACNADEAFYGASTIKAVYCLFLCERYLDTGEAKDTDCAPGFYGIDQTCPHLENWPDAGCIGNLMECALINSDNSAYESLRYPYDQGFQKWLEGIDAAPEYNPDQIWYPSFSAVQESRIWLHMRDYLASDAAHAAWLGETLQQATVSFIKDTKLPEGASVQSKAGWDASWEGGNCVSECALIAVDGRTWLFSVMTRQSPDSSSFQRATDLTQAIINALGVVPEETPDGESDTVCEAEPEAAPEDNPAAP